MGRDLSRRPLALTAPGPRRAPPARLGRSRHGHHAPGGPISPLPEEVLQRCLKGRARFPVRRGHLRQPGGVPVHPSSEVGQRQEKLSGEGEGLGLAHRTANPEMDQRLVQEPGREDPPEPVRHVPVTEGLDPEWTPSRIIRWAESVGPQTAELVKQILEAMPHPEQGYRSCLGIMRMGKEYSPQRLEAAAARSLVFKATTYKSVKSILKRGLDHLPPEAPPAAPAVPSHENVRGSAYYASGGGNQPC